MSTFDFQLRTRIVFGPDTIESLGDLAGELGARRALVASDAGIVEAGHAQRGIDALERAGIETQLFSAVHENPTTDDVNEGLKLAQRYEPELIVGLGGGSSMDCAKGINFLYTNGGRMQDYWGVGKALRPLLPMIAVPTTAGTGSETQSFALISDAKTHVKMACGDKKASFRVAILDPKLTLTQPSRVSALTGIDAISHAIETYVTTRRNPMSLIFSREAWRLLATSFARVLSAPDDLEARGNMQKGACFAGLAIENSMLGATHALANPLTANFDVTHGQAIGIMLPHVVRFNATVSEVAYQELADVLLGSGVRTFERADSESLATFLSELTEKAGLATNLGQCGVDRSAIPELSEMASKQWTATFNPRPLNTGDFAHLYRLAI